MSDYDFDPDVCRNVLHEITEEIASEISNFICDNLASTMKNTEEWRNFCEKDTIRCLQQTINATWIHFDIPKTMLQLKELSVSKNEDLICTSPNQDLHFNKAKKLLLEKEKLSKQIEFLDEQVTSKIQSIKNVTENFQRQK